MLRVSPQRKMDQLVRRLRKAKGARERALWYPRDSARRDRLLNSQEGTRAEVLAAQFNYYREFPTSPGFFDQAFHQASFVAAGQDASRFFSEASTREADRERREGETRLYHDFKDPTVQSNPDSVESTRFFSREASRRTQEDEVGNDEDRQRTHRG